MAPGSPQGIPNIRGELAVKSQLLRCGCNLRGLGDEMRLAALPVQYGQAFPGDQAAGAKPAEAIRIAFHDGGKPVALQGKVALDARQSSHAKPRFGEFPKRLGQGG